MSRRRSAVAIHMGLLIAHPSACTPVLCSPTTPLPLPHTHTHSHSANGDGSPFVPSVCTRGASAVHAIASPCLRTPGAVCRVQTDGRIVAKGSAFKIRISAPAYLARGYLNYSPRTGDGRSRGNISEIRRLDLRPLEGNTT